MIALLYLVLFAIALTEIVWRFVSSQSSNVKYIWVLAGVAWSVMLARRFHEEPGFQWQELAYGFFSIFLFLALNAGYGRLRRRSS